VRKEEENIRRDASEHVTERPAGKSPRRRKVTDDLGPPARSRRRRTEEPLDEDPVDEIEELEEVDEPPPERPKKKTKRKKKRLRPLPDEEQERETPAWVWWAAGGGGIALTFLTLLIIAMVTGPEDKLKFYSIYMLVMLPVSTVIFFVAMILANLLVGAVEIGELHVAVVKSFGLLFLVNAVSLVPYVGRYLTPLVWIPGLMLLFHLDGWETFMVMAFNWVLNFLINLFLLVALSDSAKVAMLLV